MTLEPLSPKPKISPALAAFLIMIGIGLLFYVMPTIMVWLAGYSVWLAAAFGTMGVLAFFGIFWLRARYQRKA